MFYVALTMTLLQSNVYTIFGYSRYKDYFILRI